MIVKTGCRTDGALHSSSSDNTWAESTGAPPWRMETAGWPSVALSEAGWVTSVEHLIRLSPYMIIYLIIIYVVHPVYHAHGVILCHLDAQVSEFLDILLLHQICTNKHCNET